MRLLYGLLAIMGVSALQGGITLNLTHRRWLAEEASRMKSAFMGHLSHDMRTPLTAIRHERVGTKSCPKSKAQKPWDICRKRQKPCAKWWVTSWNHAALEQGTPTLRAAPFDLRQCLEDCVSLYRPIAESKEITLYLYMDNNLPACAVGDSRLRQALGNIISNAVKFTESRLGAGLCHNQRKHSRRSAFCRVW